MNNIADNETRSKSLYELLVARCLSSTRTALDTVTMQRSKTKTLSDTMMDLCIRNFEKVFLEKSFDGTLSARADVELEPNHFESLIARSRQMCCHIRPKYLKLCLERRGPLNWQKIDLSYAGGCYEGLLLKKHINIIFRSTLPVRELSFCTNRVTLGMLMHLSECSSGLKRLEIGLDWETTNDMIDFKDEVIKKPYRKKVKLPMLKYLSLNFKVFPELLLDIFDLTSISTNLKVLKLISFNHNTYFYDPEQSTYLIDLIKNSRDLSELSLADSCFDEGDLLFEAVASLKKLKFLNLKGVELENPMNEYDAILSRTISCLPSLTHLDVSCIRGGFGNFADGELKPLKYLGRFEVWDPDLAHVEAELSGSEGSLDGLLNCLKIADSPSFMVKLLNVSRERYLNMESWNDSYRTKLEKCLFRCLYVHPFNSQLSGLIKDLADRGSSYIKWSPDFLAKLTRHFVGVHSISPRCYGFISDKYRSPDV